MLSPESFPWIDGVNLSTREPLLQGYKKMLTKGAFLVSTWDTANEIPSICLDLEKNCGGERERTHIITSSSTICERVGTQAI